MKKLLAIAALLGLAITCTLRAQSQPIATISESWQQGGHPPSQQACTSNHFNCTVLFWPDGTMNDWEFLNGGPRVNWRPEQASGYHFTGISGLQSTANADGSVTQTYTFSDLITYSNNVMAGYASGTYTRTVYEQRNVWYVRSAKLDAEVFAQAVTECANEYTECSPQ